ncbi:MAG: hypothetical protein JJ992_18410 [Planctomycetes bacterium]|nr:hypothetical protein [Planctomycetota bacterium]
MTQAELDRAVSIATGESPATISALGFNIADPDFVDYDPEPSDVEDLMLDWDAVESSRRIPLVPAFS